MRAAAGGLVALLVGVASFSVATSPEPETPEGRLRVHDLVFDRAQYSWCEPKRIRQIVTHDKCQPLEMENYVCVGACFSYSVPQTEPYTPGDENLDYCDSCQPAEIHWTTVVLECKDDDDTEYQVTKNIEMITTCSCASCRPTPAQPITNEVTYDTYNDNRITELFFNKMLPDSHRFKSTRNPLKDMENLGNIDKAMLKDLEIQLGKDKPTSTKENGGQQNLVEIQNLPPNLDQELHSDNEPSLSSGVSAGHPNVADVINKAEEFKYVKLSLKDIKNEFELSAHQEKLLSGKEMYKHAASFTDGEEGR